MRQKYPFRAFVSPFADSPVVRWIQKRQTEGVDWAMHIEAVAMNQLIDNRGRLFRTIRVQLDPVAAHVSAVIARNAVPSPMHGSIAETGEFE